MATNKENKKIELEKSENDKISFSTIIKTAKENNLKVIDLFKENIKVKKYLTIQEKKIVKTTLLENFLQTQMMIDLLSDTVSKNNNDEIINRVEELHLLKEIDITFGMLSFYCENLTFEMELTEDKEEEYDTLFEEGVYDFIYNKCKTDFDLTMGMFNREAYISSNKAATEALAEVGRQLAGQIDLTALEGLKKDIKEISELPNFESLVAISQSLQK